MTSFRLLKIIFVLFLTITITEAGYYIYTLKKDNSTHVTAPSGPVTTPSPESLEKRETIPSGPVTTPFIYEPDILEDMRKRTINEERKMNIHLESIGKVNEVKENYSDSYNRSAEIYLDIRYNNSPRQSQYFLKKNNIKIYIVSKDGQKKEASISDIKQGDKIKVNEIISIFDLKTKQFQTSYIIEVYK